MEEYEYPPGHIFFNEGDPSDCAYLLMSGEVEIYKKVQNGTVLLACIGPDQFFGEMGLIDDKPRSASASAKGVVRVKKMTREELGGIVGMQPTEFVLLMKALMERLREASQKLSEVVDYHASFSVSNNTGVPEVKRVTVRPLTDVLKLQMPENGTLISSLPYRVGAIPEGEEPNPLDWNNLFVSGADDLMSRNHFCLQKTDKGLSITDRGTKTGTLVNGALLGGGSAEFRADLKPGENIVVAGGEQSPYKFAIMWE